jgi:hypothetical protein
MPGVFAFDDDGYFLCGGNIVAGLDLEGRRQGIEVSLKLTGKTVSCKATAHIVYLYPASNQSVNYMTLVNSKKVLDCLGEFVSA